MPNPHRWLRARLRRLARRARKAWVLQRKGLRRRIPRALVAAWESAGRAGLPIIFPYEPGARWLARAFANRWVQRLAFAHLADVHRPHPAWSAGASADPRDRERFLAGFTFQRWRQHALDAAPREVFERNVSVEGFEYYERARAAGLGVILLSGHLGVDSALPVVLTRLGIPIFSIQNTRQVRPLGFRQRSPRVGRPVASLAMVEACRELARGGAVFVRGDGGAGTRRGDVEVPFLGATQRVTPAFAVMARRTGAIPVPVVAVPERGGRVRVRFFPPLPAPDRSLPRDAWVAGFVARYSAWLEARWREDPALIGRYYWRMRRGGTWDRPRAARVEASTSAPGSGAEDGGPSEPATAAGWSARADRLMDAGRLAEAIHAHRRAIRLEPTSAWHHQGLAVAIGRKGWRIAARAFHWRALELDPKEARRWHEAHPLGLDPESAVPEPVFVLGCPHSGTTILARLLGSHPAMRNAERGETHLFTRPPAEIAATLRRWDTECAAAGRRRWVEKSVTHSFCVPWLLAARPRARLILSLRDGRDVFCSLKTRRGDYRSLAALIDQWIYANLAVLDHRDDPRFLLVKYEDLVGDPVGTLTRACRHVGEAWAPEMLEYHREQIDWNQVAPPAAVVDPRDRRSYREHRTWQVNQPLFDGRNRWRTEMSDDEKRRFKRRAQRYLVEWGYAEDDGW